MKVIYDEQTDTMDIVFKDADVAESEELSPGIILDLDDHGEPVGIEILRASERIEIGSKLEFLRTIPQVAMNPGSV